MPGSQAEFPEAPVLREYGYTDQQANSTLNQGTSTQALTKFAKS
jgi:hypothetical protein